MSSSTASEANVTYESRSGGTVCEDSTPMPAPDAAQLERVASEDELVVTPRSTPVIATIAVSLAVFGLVGFLILQGVPAVLLWVTLLVVAANRRGLRARGHDIVLTPVPRTIPNARARRATAPLQAAWRPRRSRDVHPCLAPGLS